MAITARGRPQKLLGTGGILGNSGNRIPGRHHVHWLGVWCWRSSTIPATRQATSARIVKTRAKRIRLNRRSTIKGGPTETLAVVSRERPTSGNRHPGKPVRGLPIYYYHTPEFGHLRNRPLPPCLLTLFYWYLYTCAKSVPTSSYSVPAFRNTQLPRQP